MQPSVINSQLSESVPRIWWWGKPETEKGNGGAQSLVGARCMTRLFHQCVPDSQTESSQAKRCLSRSGKKMREKHWYPVKRGIIMPPRTRQEKKKLASVNPY